FTHARFLPGSKILESQVRHSLLCDGAIIDRGRLDHTIIGIRSRIGENSIVERAVIMGADFFESGEQLKRNKEKGIPNIGIGKNCEIRNAIIDKNARIGNNVKLVNGQNRDEVEEENYMIRDGIIVVPKNGIIPDDTII
ncbi:MAG: glucose-1-phosphate adenylyltransferase, partial [Calditrichia bacterium]